MDRTSRLKDGNIVAGAGYSTDSQQVASEVCYNATVSSISGQSSSLQLDTAQSFSDIQNDVRMSVSLKGGVGMFSANAQASYLQSMEDKEYSMSLNYYYYAFTTAAIQLAGYGLDALTATGKSFYDNGNNPYFGILCGDQYITSYDEGAMLLMGINIEFSSNYEKEQFNAHAGASFGDIFSTSGKIQQIASQYDITGSVVMQAFQIGGDPSQLSYILNKDGNGDYYVLTCSLNAMSNCISAASGMLDYAKYNITTQFSFANNTGLTPIGPGFMSYNPIYYVGLTPPPSLVTPQVIEDRLTLANSLLENQYYEQKFYELLYGYPVPWDTTSNIYKTSQILYQNAQSNVAILASPSNPEAGGLGCFTFPNQCDNLTKTIQESLVPITTSSLEYLSQIQYYFNVPCYMCELEIYMYSDGDNDNNWYYFNTGGDSMVQIDYFVINQVNYTAHYLLSYPNHWYSYNGTSNDNGATYTGPYVDDNEGNKNWVASTQRYTNSFYFQAYNDSNPEADMSGIVSTQDTIEV